MKIDTYFSLGAAALLLTLGQSALAAPVSLAGDSCPNEWAVDTDIGDVTADFDTPTGCYGPIYGKTSGPGSIEKDGFTDGTDTYDLLIKLDFGEGYEGDLDLKFTMSDGEWEFTNPAGIHFMDPWAFVIKQGNCWAAWTFAGDTLVYGGDYTANFMGVGDGGDKSCVENRGNFATYSHAMIFGGDFEVPEPGALALLGLGLVGLGFARRRTSS